MENTTQIIISLIVIFLAIGIHEYAHAKMADLCGDPTPRIYGRVTLNLAKHFDPFGILMIMITVVAGFGIGWGKPVPMDPRKMRNPRWDHFWSVAAGPLSNLIQAGIYAIALRFMLQLLDSSEIAKFEYILIFLHAGVYINLSLCFFNLLPLAPLDGHWLIGTLLPSRSQIRWYQWNRQIGPMLLLGMIFLGQFNPQFNIFRTYLMPLVEGAAKFLFGTN